MRSSASDTRHDGSDVLSGWKDIARYLGMAVRTAQRYEQGAALPVHRPAGRLRAAVVASRAELDVWVAAGAVPGGFRASAVAGGDGARDRGAALKELRGRLEEFQEARRRNAQLRGELRESLQLLQSNLWRGLR